jgi:hypothetical protein
MVRMCGAAYFLHWKWTKDRGFELTIYDSGHFLHRPGELVHRQTIGIPSYSKASIQDIDLDVEFVCAKDRARLVRAVSISAP